ncbi:unnamed protein product [Blepharisma stoltei]|uniref:Uncharacterized protein n=1 Tax=Blepharisma stoltei TaxID=1481888 RepID=A0AAU9I989_9CILI|nr:unnamed protein product [Blepharisma stoltei]
MEMDLENSCNLESSIIINGKKLRTIEIDTEIKVNYQTKQEMVSLINWTLKQITEQKELQILNASQKITKIKNDLSSYIQKSTPFQMNVPIY